MAGSFHYQLFVNIVMKESGMSNCIVLHAAVALEFFVAEWFLLKSRLLVNTTPLRQNRAEGRRRKKTQP